MSSRTKREEKNLFAGCSFKTSMFPLRVRFKPKLLYDPPSSPQGVRRRPSVPPPPLPLPRVPPSVEPKARCVLILYSCCCSCRIIVSVICAACLSISSMRSSVTDLRGMILGLLSTSLKLPFSLYTNPALGSTSVIWSLIVSFAACCCCCCVMLLGDACALKPLTPVLGWESIRGERITKKPLTFVFFALVLRPCPLTRGARVLWRVFLDSHGMRREERAQPRCARCVVWVVHGGVQNTHSLAVSCGGRVRL